MKYAILSDIHANSSALETALADAGRLGAQKIVCAGDVVGYGPSPAETIRILREREIPTVSGNHDAVVAGRRGPSGMIGHARNTDARHHALLGKCDLEWLRSLPYVYEDDAIAVAHANFVSPEGMDYIHERIAARDSIFHVERRMMFVGHTHLEAAYAFWFPPEERYPMCEAMEPEDFRAVEGRQYLVNAGSVGYPRVKPYSCYVLYDSVTGDVVFRRIPFDFAGYIAELKAKSFRVPSWISASQGEEVGRRVEG